MARQHCSQIKKVLDEVYPDGLNFEEISNKAGFSQNTQASRRMIDLERKGWAERYRSNESNKLRKTCTSLESNSRRHTMNAMIKFNDSYNADGFVAGVAFY